MIALTIPDRWQATRVAVTSPGRTPRRLRRGSNYFVPCRSCPAVLLHFVIASQPWSTRATATYSKIRPQDPALTPVPRQFVRCCGAATWANDPKTPQVGSRPKIAVFRAHARPDLAEARTVTPNVLRRVSRDDRLCGPVPGPGGSNTRGSCARVVGVAQHLLGNDLFRHRDFALCGVADCPY